MPPRTPRPCKAPNCGVLTVNPGCLCDAHKHHGWERHQAGLSRHQRGYGSLWEKIRARILTRDRHLCQPCFRAGLVKSANIVDHIVAKAHGGTDSDKNLESICADCHAKKTATERLNTRNSR